MFKELFKKWFGRKKTKPNYTKKTNVRKFTTIEETRDFILSIKGNKTYNEVAKYLNRRGYRTVRGCLFTVTNIQNYMYSDVNLNKYREIRYRNYYAKKNARKGVTSWKHPPYTKK